MEGGLYTTICFPSKSASGTTAKHNKAFLPRMSTNIHAQGLDHLTPQKHLGWAWSSYDIPQALRVGLIIL